MLLKSIFATALCWMVTGCRSPETTSDMTVSNGSPIGKDQAPAVVRLDMPNNTICTGTFLNQSVVLTAAHCIYSVPYAEISGVRSINSYLASSNFKALYAAAKASRWLGPDNDAMVPNDQALVIFPAGTAGKLGIRDFISIERGTHLTGLQVYLIGYGENNPGQGSSDGVKRWGSNIVASFDGQVITVKGDSNGGPGVGRNSTEGDSGGPLLWAGANGSGQTIIGTVSEVADRPGPGISYYVAVQSPISQALFRYAISKGAEYFYY